MILDEIIQQKLEVNTRLRRSKDGFEKPSYAAFQADCNAYERALEEVRKLILFKKEK